MRPQQEVAAQLADAIAAARQTSQKLALSALQEVLDRVHSVDNNDASTFLQAAALCAWLSEIAMINNNRLPR